MNSSETITERSNVPEVYEVEIKASPKFPDINFNLVGNDTTTALNNDTFTFQGNKIVVRPEEALIVIFVLILWVAAIGLFFHRWGKIRNCEPYTPKFEADDHRGSCHDQTNLINKRMSMSAKLSTPGPSLPLTSNPHSFTKGVSPTYVRSRQNSVFISPLQMTPTLQGSRRTKSALDLHSMISEDDCDIV